jgi:membrane fusion protein (multidrug efflux system)
MRLFGQLVVITVLAAGAGAGWYFKDDWWPGGATKAAPARQVPVPLVEVRKVRVGAVDETFDAVGTALANEAVTITAKISGIVARTNFEEGQAVKAGDVLVEFDDREFKAELENAKALLENATQAYQRARQLLDTKSGPQARVDETGALMRAAQARVRVNESKLQDLKVTAPFSGRVGLRRISVGALIAPGAVITTLDDVETIKARFSLPETVLADLKPGVPITVRTATYPDRGFSGKVTSIDTRIDPVTRSIETRAEVPNRSGLLKPGMYMTIQVALGRRENALLIPEEALVPEGMRQNVFVLDGNRVRKTEVKIGVRLPGEVEVREGLKPDAVVVVGGVQKIRDGSQVRIVPAPGAASPPAPSS